MVTAKQVDVLNVVLLLLSLLIAFYLPFQLFLFSYAVLGPLHYLTEIRWLSKKQFFVTNKRWAVVFLIACTVIIIPSLVRLPIFSTLYSMPWVKQVLNFLSRYYGIIMLGCLFFSAVLVLLRQASNYFLWLIISIAASMLVLKYLPFAYVVFDVFLPTIIHVYLFTILFMIYGNLKVKSLWCTVAIMVLTLIPLIIILLPINTSNYVLSDAIKAILFESGFNKLAIYLAKIFSSNNEVLKQPALSVMGIKIQIFIAFSYTYHYLNWFSKTSIIGWGKQLPIRHLLIIGCIWLLAVVLYWYNYIIGFRVLAFLSLLHVLLEFPLNITSIKAITIKLLSK